MLGCNLTPLQTIVQIPFLSCMSERYVLYLRCLKSSSRVSFSSVCPLSESHNRALSSKLRLPFLFLQDMYFHNGPLDMNFHWIHPSQFSYFHENCALECNKSRCVQDWIQHIQGPRAGAVWHKGLHTSICLLNPSSKICFLDDLQK